MIENEMKAKRLKHYPALQLYPAKRLKYYPACPDGYFYGGEIEQPAERDMVVEKGEQSPTYRCFVGQIVKY